MTTQKGHGPTERIQQLRTRIAQALGQLRREQRKQQRQAQAVRARRLQAHGELVTRALRPEEDLAVVFGWLLDNAAHMRDPTQRTHWQTMRAQALTQDHRLQRTVHRLWEQPSPTPSSAEALGHSGTPITHVTLEPHPLQHRATLGEATIRPNAYPSETTHVPECFRQPGLACIVPIVPGADCPPVARPLRASLGGRSGTCVADHAFP
jgi:hypothetical protein